ncbi:MAG: peptidase [Persicimonas sp.]
MTQQGAKPQGLEIFRAGTWTDMHGRTIEFSRKDVEAIAEAYDPELAEAPIVVGHPKDNDPAYGWIRSLVADEHTVLRAEPHQVERAFAEIVAQGRYKKISSSFYQPDSPANPKPGSYYLRHVGFLGAQPPAVRGLKDAQFSEVGEADVVEFQADLSQMTNATLWRRLREFFLSQFGMETADTVIPSYAVKDLEDEANDNPEPAMAEGTTLTARPLGAPADPQEDTMGQKELEQQKADIAKQKAELDDREAKFAERAKEQRLADVRAKVEGLVEDGRVLPADKEPLVAFLGGLDAETTLEFSDGEGFEGKKVSTPAAQWFEKFLERMPKQVDYSERARSADLPPDQSDPVALAEAARTYQAEQRLKGIQVTARDAVRHVVAGS